MLSFTFGCDGVERGTRSCVEGCTRFGDGPCKKNLLGECKEFFMINLEMLIATIIILIPSFGMQMRWSSSRKKWESGCDGDARCRQIHTITERVLFPMPSQKHLLCMRLDFITKAHLKLSKCLQYKAKVDLDENAAIFERMWG